MTILKFVLILTLLLTFNINKVQAVDALSVIRTGVAVLDAALNETAYLGSQTRYQNDIIREISWMSGLSSATILNLHRQGYNFGEIYYLGLLHRQTGLPVRSLLSHRSQGIGWGELAHRIGVHPSTLNKTRVSLKKSYTVKPVVHVIHDDDDDRDRSSPVYYKGKKNKLEKMEHKKEKGKGHGHGHGHGKGKKNK